MSTKTITKVGSGGAGALTIGSDYGDGTPTASAAVGAVTLSATSTDRLAAKDTWVPDVAGCVDNTNKDTTDLQVEGVTATRKDTYIAFDLSALPSGTTVTQASLTVNLKSAPTVNTGGVDLNHSLGNESWNETTITCSGALALTQFQNEAAGTWVGTGDKTITLNSTARSRIASVMGSSHYTIALTAPSVLFANMSLQSKDSGGSPGNSSGPRLTITFTKTL